MRNTRIRRFRPGDVPSFVRIVKTVFEEYGAIFDIDGYDGDLADIEKRYAKGDFFALEEDGVVVGMVSVTEEAGSSAELHRLYIDPTVRGRGYGRMLAEHVIAWTRARGLARLYLWSDVRFTHAHAMYRACGFEQRGERICQDIEKSREYGFEMILGAHP